jgi:hypothetical protein
MDDGTMVSTDDAMALIRATDADPRGTVLMLLRVLGGGLATATRERDEARAEVERLREQARVWRTLAYEGSIASQGAAAEREACAAIAQGIAVAASRAADYTANTLSPDGDATWESGRAAGASQTERAIRARGAGGGA